MGQVRRREAVAHVLEVQQRHLLSTLDQHVRGLQIAMNQSPPRLDVVINTVVGEGMRLPAGCYRRALDPLTN